MELTVSQEFAHQLESFKHNQGSDAGVEETTHAHTCNHDVLWYGKRDFCI